MNNRNDQIGEICNKNFLLIPDSKSIEESIILLHNNKSNNLIVTHEGNYIKFITEKEICNEILRNGLLPENKHLSDLIKEDEKLNIISSRMSIIECLNIMYEKGSDEMIVSEGITGISGVITMSSIFNYIGDKLEEDKEERDVNVKKSCRSCLLKIADSLCIYIF